MVIRLNRNQHKHTRFFVLLAFLFALVMVRYSFLIDIPRALLLLIIVVAAFWGDRDEIVAMCMCCIPLHESIDFFYTTVICMVAYIFKYHKDIKVNLTFVPIVIMVLWELLHGLGESISIVGFLTDIIPLLVLLVFLCADVSKYNYAFIARTVAVATVVVCFMLLLRVLYLADFNFATAFAGLQRLGIDASISKHDTMVGGRINPNSVGIICVLSVTALIQLRTSGGGKKKDIFLSCVLLIFGTLTSSRTYLVCLALMVLLLILSQKGGWKKKIRLFGILLVVLIFAYAVLSLFFQDLIEYYFGRFQESDITTGRTELMEKYHEFIVGSPKVMLYGIGLYDFGPKLVDTYMVAGNTPHNAIQELIVAWGFPGLALIVILIFMMISRSRRFCEHRGLINYIPLIIIIVKSQAGQMICSPYTMLALSFAYLSMTQNLLDSNSALKKK